MHLARSFRGSASAAASAPPAPAFVSRFGRDCSRKNRNLLLQILRRFGEKRNISSVKERKLRNWCYSDRGDVETDDRTSDK
jgi:hypothetical protein